MVSPLYEAVCRVYFAAQANYRLVTPVTTKALEEETYWVRNTALVENTDELPNATLIEEGWRRVTDKVSFVAQSPLRFFLDGSQRTRLLFIADSIPVCYTVSTALLLERRVPGGALQPVPNFHLSHAAILLPDAPAVRPLWDLFERLGFPPENTLSSHFLRDHNLTPEQVVRQFELSRFLAYERARQLRENLERQLVLAWVAQAHHEWLVIDGDLRHVGLDVKDQAILGVIKQHKYESVAGQSLTDLFGLPLAHRSELFRLRAAQGDHLKSSFFLRWKARPLKETPHFGLLRLETPLALTSSQADDISRWVLAESTPYTAGRNGNHLYPIAHAEQLAKQLARAQWSDLPPQWFF